MLISKNSVVQTKSYLSEKKRGLVRLMVNDLPTWCINTGYDYYSMFYTGQLRLGLPVSAELIKTQEEIRQSAAGKLALTLYHIYWRATGTKTPRMDIKRIILDEMGKGYLRLTENVIMLTQEQLKYLTQIRLQIPAYFFAAVLEEAHRRRILREDLKGDRLPVYFESEIEEREENGRGDYETVYYREYTYEGREIRFRRLLSMEDVTAGDNRPSVVMVPGFANNSNCFNINNEYSVAKDLADRGCWIYLFDPRGMGVNSGKFDPLYTVDTIIDHDLPTVVNFVNARSKGKPSFLVGHSMGGIVAENMALVCNMRLKLNDLEHLGTEEKNILDLILPSQKAARKRLRAIRGIISLGAPKHFERTSHLVFPTVLWLNHLARIFRFHKVPIREIFWALTQPPVLRKLGQGLFSNNIGELNFLLCPENHPDDKRFARHFVYSAMESVPLGLGFQFLKAIYNGEGFKRMDESRLNYSQNLAHMPDNIPTFHFHGTKDPLAPLTNLRYSELYPHRVKKVYHLENVADLKKVEITDEPSQLIDFVIEGANHFDLMYGKLADELVQPLVAKIIEDVWDQWDYE